MILHSHYDNREINIPLLSGGMIVQRADDYEIVIVDGISYAVKESNREIWENYLREGGGYERGT